jgi:uncharacterized protein involved in type VI secretion and phage assembly
MLDATPLEMIVDARVPTGLGGRWYGVYPATVTAIKDAEHPGAVKVTLPWSPDTGSGRYEAWARVATLMGGNNRGSWFIPDINDEVLVAFQGGDPRQPFVLGGLWNGQDKPPEAMDGAGKNYRKVLRSRNGVKITLDDTDGKEQLILETPGQQTVTLSDGPSSIQIADSNGNSLKMDANGITIITSGQLNIQAGTATHTAGQVTVNAGMSQFSGAVKCDTHIANSVISASYTPGAGNIW